MQRTAGTSPPNAKAFDLHCQGKVGALTSEMQRIERVRNTDAWRRPAVTCLGWGQRGLARRQAEESLGNRLHGKPQDTCNGLEFTQEAVQLTLQNPYAVHSYLGPK